MDYKELEKKVEKIRGTYISKEHTGVQTSAIRRLLLQEKESLEIIRDKITALSQVLHILQTLRDVKMPETKGKYEGVDEPLKISSLYVWNKYNEGFDLALQELRPYIASLTLRVEELTLDAAHFEMGKI